MLSSHCLRIPATAFPPKAFISTAMQPQCHLYEPHAAASTVSIKYSLVASSDIVVDRRPKYTLTVPVRSQRCLPTTLAMNQSEALPYRIAVGKIFGVPEYRSVRFVEASSPPKRLVCAVCRAVSATEPRYKSPTSGDVMCWECAQDLCATALGEDRVADSAGEQSSEWPKPSLALREPAVEGDLDLLNDLEVVCPNADLNCSFRGKFRVLPIHLSSTCAHDFIACRGCGDRVLHRDFYEHLELRDCLKRAAAAATDDGFQLTWGPSSLLYIEANRTQNTNGASNSSGAAAENWTFIREVGPDEEGSSTTPVSGNGVAAATPEKNGGRILRLPILLWEAAFGTKANVADRPDDAADSPPVILEATPDGSESSTNAIKNGTAEHNDQFVILDHPRSSTNPSGKADVDDDPPVWIPTPLGFEAVFGKSAEWDHSMIGEFRKVLFQRGREVLTGKLLVRFPDRSSYRARSASTGTLLIQEPAVANAPGENRGEDELALGGFRLKGHATLFDYDARGRGAASSSASGTELATFELLARDAGDAGKSSGGLRWPARKTVVLTLNGFCSGNSSLTLRTRYSGDMPDIQVGEEWTKVAVTYPVDAATVWKEFAVLDIVELTVELR
ncbi:uncharacterized protein LOC119431945 [Dermacentor silvarum]|uniref:uncharacterized protein LOC119431945 n=1 Tax=Dermacentor silvarum TaxID=543639 RepID=UPI0021008651|nr:uncharacterized protein LOC119431945 [Dermacentor silvarum]